MDKIIIEREEPGGTLFYDGISENVFSENSNFLNRLSTPLFVIWEITNKCNLDCIFCSAFDEGNDLTINECMKIAQKLVKSKIFWLQISGGEPLLRKDIFKIISFFHKNSIDVLLYTNGTLLDLTTINKLKESGVKRVVVSLCGLEDVQDRLRKKGTFKRVVNNVKLALKNKLPLSIITVITKYNYGKIENFFDKFIKMGVEEFRILDMMPSGKGKETFYNMHITKEELKRLSEIISEYSKKAKIICETPMDFSTTNQYRCGAALFYFRINYRGFAIPCAFFPERINGGNLLKDDMKKIWFSKMFKSFRNILLNQNRFEGKCKTCDLFNSCHGGCRAISFFKHGSLKKSDERCYR